MTIYQRVTTALIKLSFASLNDDKCQQRQATVCGNIANENGQLVHQLAANTHSTHLPEFHTERDSNNPPEIKYQP